MKRITVVWALSLLLLSICLVLASGSAAAVEPEIKAALEKIAAAIEKGDDASARQQAKALAKKIDTLDEVMHGFKLRSKKGLGVGPKAGAVTPDGIELKLNALSRDSLTPKQMEKEAKAIEQMAYLAAAINEVGLASTPKKDVGKKKKSDWINWSEGAIKTSKELAAAAKAMNIAGVKTAATKVNGFCNSCHTNFK